MEKASWYPDLGTLLLNYLENWGWQYGMGGLFVATVSIYAPTFYVKQRYEEIGRVSLTDRVGNICFRKHLK